MTDRHTDTGPRRSSRGKNGWLKLGRRWTFCSVLAHRLRCLHTSTTRSRMCGVFRPIFDRWAPALSASLSSLAAGSDSASTSLYQSVTSHRCAWRGSTQTVIFVPPLRLYIGRCGRCAGCVPLPAAASCFTGPHRSAHPA